MTEIRPARIADLDELQRLVERHPFAEYRSYRIFQHDFAADYLARTVRSLLESNCPMALLALSEGRAAGFIAATRSPAESACFAMEMASIPFVLHDGTGAAREGVKALLAALMAEARTRGIQHLTLKVDVADMTTVHAAEQLGYRLVDTLVTYVDVAARRPIPEPHPAFELTSYGKDELDRLTPDEIDPLADFMRTSYHVTRFHMDHRLPAERSGAIYDEWCRNLFNGKWADMVHIARRGGRPVGFLGHQSFHELEERYSVKIIGRGLAGVLPEGRGAYAALVAATMAHTPDFAEYDTQIQNFPAINVWIRFGFAFLRGRFTLHRWLDE